MLQKLWGVGVGGASDGINVFFVAGLLRGCLSRSMSFTVFFRGAWKINRVL